MTFCPGKAVSQLLKEFALLTEDREASYAGKEIAEQFSLTPRDRVIAEFNVNIEDPYR